MAPTKPLRLQVIDRIIVVLQAIVEGDSFWKTTGQVARRWIAPTEAIAFPVYGVHSSDGQALEEDAGEYREEFAVVVEGVIKSATDTVTEMEHALADVRRAVDADSRSGDPGTLGALTVFVRVGRSWTDEGENVANGLGHFWQEFLVQIAGDPFGA